MARTDAPGTMPFTFCEEANEMIVLLENADESEESWGDRFFPSSSAAPIASGRMIGIEDCKTTFSIGTGDSSDSLHDASI